MSYRGRLIFPLVVEIAPIDTAATELAGGYDHVFNEPLIDAAGASAVVYGEPYLLQAQVQTEAGRYDALDPMANGDAETTLLWTLFHYLDLEDQGRIDASGRATIRKGDRLLAIYNTDNVLVREFATRHVIATMVQDRSFGLSAQRRNLLRVQWESRDRGSRNPD